MEKRENAGLYVETSRGWKLLWKTEKMLIISIFPLSIGSLKFGIVWKRIKVIFPSLDYDHKLSDGHLDFCADASIQSTLKCVLGH